MFIGAVEVAIIKISNYIFAQLKFASRLRPHNILSRLDWLSFIKAVSCR